MATTTILFWALVASGAATLIAWAFCSSSRESEFERGIELYLEGEPLNARWPEAMQDGWTFGWIGQRDPLMARAIFSRKAGTEERPRS
jgi:hypothetical protein